MIKLAAAMGSAGWVWEPSGSPVTFGAGLAHQALPAFLCASIKNDTDWVKIVTCPQIFKMLKI